MHSQHTPYPRTDAPAGILSGGVCNENTAQCERWSKSLTGVKGYCIPKDAQMNSKSCRAASFIKCNKGFTSRTIFSLDKGRQGTGCLYTCFPNAAPDAAFDTVPVNRCLGEWECKKDKARCTNNFYYAPGSKDGFNKWFGVCKTWMPLLPAQCAAAEPHDYIICPRFYKGVSFFQDEMGCYFACEKSSGRLKLWIFVAVVLGIGLLLVIFFLWHLSK